MPTSKAPAYERYLDTYGGKELLKKHSLEEHGTWLVYGEDPNCDFGGPHHQPFLGTFEGRLCDVLEEVTQLGGFWQWGAGGRVEKATIQQVSAMVKKVSPQRVKASNSPASMVSLFDLVEQKTKEGKIKWEGSEYSSKLTGTVPGTGMTIVIEHWTGDQRDPADEYYMKVTVNGNTVNVGTTPDVKKLFRYIVEKPAKDTEADAREILESL